MQARPRSIAEAIGIATARLAASGLGGVDARMDARVMARHAFGLDDTGLILREPDAPPPDALARYWGAVARRAAFEPVAYITGHREFYGRDFLVSPAVLVPRPETELIVELALARFPDRQAGIEIVDVGTGSGCLAVTLACEFPRARLVATDVSLDAIEVARRNAARHGVADRVAFHHASLVAGADQADLIVSNPPYVAVGQRPSLPPDVRDHEPAIALFAGEDGLDVIRALIARVGECGALRRGSGWLVFEIGHGQAPEVTRLLRADGRYDDVTVANDLQGIPRTACARRSPR
jgi:release factor glutamine methyltransferase